MFGGCVYYRAVIGDEIPPKFSDSPKMLRYVINTKFYPPNLLISPVLLSYRKHWVATDCDKLLP